MKKKEKLPDSLVYPPNEDIYNKLKKEIDINPEDISKRKISIEINNSSKMNQKDFEDDMSGGDLDIPGAELDDQQENIGSEDEENNGYSIGGDNHHNLEENKE
ncbi:hypothetical protein [Flavobacterium cellulosilyticum]|uniref:Uncharacterized protein n=1 Tax=Flavobacterium cellulosilyticum TaxID=2541731 RepID=A0A4R5CB43_9FLAO|nr:hypothetical protein [Flavobacterium cellulosilyticum]TDD94292.1 hypothetical protein E0F76_16985 [Flavobacterium cellulosilyticum]